MKKIDNQTSIGVVFTGPINPLIHKNQWRSLVFFLVSLTIALPMQSAVGEVTVDSAPQITSSYPLNGATDFPINANLSVTFSEPVNVTSAWFTLACSVSGMVTTSFSGGPTTYTLNPSVSLVNGESCTLTVLANHVSDQETDDPPDNMTDNYVVGFTPVDVCATSFTPIYHIQGSGLSAAITVPKASLTGWASASAPRWPTCADDWATGKRTP